MPATLGRSQMFVFSLPYLTTFTAFGTCSSRTKSPRVAELLTRDRCTRIFRESPSTLCVTSRTANALCPLKPEIRSTVSGEEPTSVTFSDTVYCISRIVSGTDAHPTVSKTARTTTMMFLMSVTCGLYETILHIQSPYSHFHGTPASPKMSPTISGNAFSARTSMDSRTTQRCCSDRQTQTLPTLSSCPPL